MKLKRMIQLSITGALVCLLISTLPLPGQAQDNSPHNAQRSQTTVPVPQPGTVLPKTAATCLESAGKTFEVVATQVEKDKAFYYLHVWLYGAGDDFESWYSLIQVDPSGCRRLRGVRSGLKPLSSFMAMSTARQLELQRYRHEIARAGGKQVFEQQLNQKLSPPPHSAYSGVTIYLSEEQVWALQQLGIRFPNTYRLLRPGETVRSKE